MKRDKQRNVPGTHFATGHSEEQIFEATHMHAVETSCRFTFGTSTRDR